VSQLTGQDALRRRLRAISEPKELLREVALLSVAEAKGLVPVRTGNLRRTIRVGPVTAKSARVLAGGTRSVGYARYVEEGTGIYGPKGQPIRPKKARMLSWKSGGKRVFAKSVRGRKATPYLVPGIRAAIAKAGLKEAVIDAWNDAA
jgi:hypothetical protein